MIVALDSLPDQTLFFSSVNSESLNLRLLTCRTGFLHLFLTLLLNYVNLRIINICTRFSSHGESPKCSNLNLKHIFDYLRNALALGE